MMRATRWSRQHLTQSGQRGRSQSRARLQEKFPSFHIYVA